MNIVKEVYEQWKDFKFESIDDEIRAKTLLETCVDCDEFIKRRKVCKRCGCYVPTKITGMSSDCPMSKWKKGSSY